jgi:hypothetical protein
MIDQLLTIRKKQLKIFEDLTMFEQRILCHELPSSFNSITIHDNQENCVTKRIKMVQDLKRQMLNTELERYEMEIQQYEDLYEQELTTCKSEIYKTQSSYQIDRFNELIYYVKIYVYHHTQLLLRQVRYKESCFHVKLQRCHHRRHRSSPSSNTIDVYPQIIVDVPKVLLIKNQLNYLSRTGKFLISFNYMWI